MKTRFEIKMTKMHINEKENEILKCKRDLARIADTETHHTSVVWYEDRIEELEQQIDILKDEIKEEESMNAMLLASTDFESMDKGKLIGFALDILKNDDDIFTACVEELDNYNGYADGFRAYDMSELDDFYCDCKATKLLDDLTADFNKYDDYFYFSIYGLESTDSKIDLYRSNVDEDCMLDELLEHYDRLSHDYIDNDFAELIQAIATFPETDEE